MEPLSDNIQNGSVERETQNQVADLQNKLIASIIKPRVRKSSVVSEDGQNDTGTNTTTTGSSSSDEEDLSMVSNDMPTSSLKVSMTSFFTI